MYRAVDDFAGDNDRQSRFRPEYRDTGGRGGIFCGCDIRRAETKISDARRNPFQNQAIRGREFSQFPEFAGIRLRAVSEVVVPAVDIGLHRFENGRSAHPDGYYHPGVEPHLRETFGLLRQPGIKFDRPGF